MTHCDLTRSFALVSIVGLYPKVLVLPINAALSLALVSAEGLVFAALIFARVSTECTLPLLFTPIFALVSAEIV